MSFLSGGCRNGVADYKARLRFIATRLRADADQYVLVLVCRFVRIRPFDHSLVRASRGNGAPTRRALHANFPQRCLEPFWVRFIAGLSVLADCYAVLRAHESGEPHQHYLLNIAEARAVFSWAR